MSCFFYLLDHSGIVVRDVPNRGSMGAFLEREHRSG